MTKKKGPKGSGTDEAAMAANMVAMATDIAKTNGPKRSYAYTTIADCDWYER